MFNRAKYAVRLAALLLGLSSAITVRADDQQMVEDFLDNLNVYGHVIRPITTITLVGVSRISVSSA